MVGQDRAGPRWVVDNDSGVLVKVNGRVRQPRKAKGIDKPGRKRRMVRSDRDTDESAISCPVYHSSAGNIESWIGCDGEVCESAWFHKQCMDK